VARYSVPYRLQIVMILGLMVLHAGMEIAPIALIDPVLENLTHKDLATRSEYPSDEVMATLEDGTEISLADLLSGEEPGEEDWHEKIPGMKTLREWISKNPKVEAILFGVTSEVPPVRVNLGFPDFTIEDVEVFVLDSVWQEGEWRSIATKHPALVSRVASMHYEPRELEPPPLLFYALLVPVLYLIKGLIGVARHLLLGSVALHLIRDIQNDLYKQVLKQPLGFFHTARTGDLMSRLVNDVMVLSKQIVTVLMDLLQSPILVISAFCFCFYKDWQLALTLIIVVPGLALPMQVMSRKIRKASRKAQEKRADISSVLVETLTGIEVVKAFNMEDYEQDRYAEETQRLLDREMKIRKNRALSTPTTEMGAAFGVTAVILIAMWRMAQDPSFGFGELATIAATFMVMIKPLDRFWKARFILGEMGVAGERIFAVMDREPEIQDKPGAIPPPSNWSSIRFDRVSFSYGDEMVLREIDLDVQRGKKIAIVGKTGAGKTTLVNLLARFYEPTSGRILLGEHDLRDLTLSGLLSQIGIVTQRNVLFNDTVANNIAYGRPDISREEIEAAAKAAYADEFIQEMPQGYDTLIGEMGTRLSGGQAQRVAIARAVLKNPPILILDEATASLDTASEKMVQNALDNLMENRTTFAIAHRLSTVLNADRILVLHQGRIVESGTHEELYALGGAYKNLYDMQFTSQELASGRAS
jgi:subfamily B ATP-binding cassette protein MsbA